MCRDPKLFKTFGKAWYAKNPTFKSYPSFPKTLLKSTSFESVSAPALEVYSKFIGKLQSYLGATVANFSIAAQWNLTSGSTIPIGTYFNEVRYYAIDLRFADWGGTDVFDPCCVSPMGKRGQQALYRLRSQEWRAKPSYQSRCPEALAIRYLSRCCELLSGGHQPEDL